jgi:hypothetical protein
MKNKVLLLIVISLFSCTTQSLAVKNWFPAKLDNIANYGPIFEYMSNFYTDDINVARHEYLFVIVFIVEMIDASYENLERAYSLDSPTVKRPALINGELRIIESIEMANIINLWNDNLMEYEKVAAVEVLWEFLHIIEYNKLLNDLFEHWYSLTGELLGDYIDILALYDKLEEDIKPLLKPGPYLRPSNKKYCN